MNFLKKINKYDVLLLIALSLSALIIYIFYNKAPKDGIKAQILINGETAYTVSLEENKTFSLPELSSVEFEISDGKIRFIKSDCPDKICINTGYIDKAGQIAVCLPNAVSLKIIPINVSSVNSPDVMI